MSSVYVNEPATNGKVCLKTTVGDIEIELWSKECPLAARNFVQLCLEGYYDGTVFHRVIKGFIVQGGDPTGTGQGGKCIYEKPFKNEFHQRLKFNHRGLVGTATGDDGLNGSQFFFTLGATPSLDKKHSIFGKVVGNTLFNMLRLSECEIDENDRPVNLQKILAVDVINNPFHDIVPRAKKKEKEKKREEKKIRKEVKKNLALLSFGDEAEEDELELRKANEILNTRSKSAHDVLQDETLSKELAVPIEELEQPSTTKTNDVDSESEERIKKIREKLKGRKRKADDDEIRNEIDELPDEDYEQMMKQEMNEREKAELEKIAAEVRLARHDLRALLKPKKVEENVEEKHSVSDAVKQHREMKQKFRKTVPTLKPNDPKRQDETMAMLEKLINKHRGMKSATDTITSIKKPEPKLEKEETEVPTGKLNLDSEQDLSASELVTHSFVAPAESAEVSKAKDANLREESEDWYDIDDPRNKINQRRRGL